MGEQRLTEFFWEIVLANTTAPVTIFLDEIERASELPFSRHLFAAIRACYSGRTTEPDLGRLNFVALGIASPRQLCPDPSLSPFEDGRAIDLEDFTLEQTYGLAPGFSSEPEQAYALLETIFGWANGQPYLTQKIARGVARRGSKPEDVDRVVREGFLSPGALREEPLLNHTRTVLAQGVPHSRQALVLLGKLGKGARVSPEAGSAAQQALHLAGIVAKGAHGQLTFRNRLFRSVFTSRWVNSVQPFDWRGFSVAAVLIGAKNK